MQTNIICSKDVVISAHEFCSGVQDTACWQLTTTRCLLTYLICANELMQSALEVLVRTLQSVICAYLQRATAACLSGQHGRAESASEHADS